MTGLLKQAQQEPQQAEQPQQGNAQAEQQVYTKIVEMALTFVYSEDGREMVREGLELGGAEIVQNIGNTVAKVLMRLVISANTAGKSIPPRMLFQAGMEITSAVTEMAEALGLTDNAPGVAKQAFFAALTITGREMPEEIMSEQERAEVKALIEQVQQMDGAAAPEQQKMSGGAK